MRLPTVVVIVKFITSRLFAWETQRTPLPADIFESAGLVIIMAVAIWTFAVRCSLGDAEQSTCEAQEASADPAVVG